MNKVAKAMHISVDIDRTRNHIHILQEERNEAQALVGNLTLWRKQAVLDGFSDIGLVEEHLLVARKQVLNIQQRISFLESLIDEFSGVKNVTAKLLDEAIEERNSSQSNAF